MRVPVDISGKALLFWKKEKTQLVLSLPLLLALNKNLAVDAATR